MKLTPPVLLAVIENSQGNISKIQRRLKERGITAGWHTIENAINHWEKTRNAFADERETSLDLAEDGLTQALHKHEPWAIKFMLSTRGKSRGYTTETSVNLNSTEPLNINLTGSMFSADELRGSPDVEITGYDESSE